jgi:glycosyltransferase involved in cell wall biosynthesis
MCGRVPSDAVSSARRPIVGLVTDAIYPYNCGGKELRYHELIARLAEHADVHVYTMNWWAGRRVRREGNVTYHALCRAWPLYSGERRSVAQAAFFAIGCLRLFWCKFDVLEADHMPYLQIPVLRLVTLLKRKRLVVTWHEVWGRRYWLQYLGWPGVAAWLMESCAMRLPDHIVAASPQTAARLRAALGPRAKISVAPNGIDLDAVRSAEPIGPRTDLAVVNRLLSHKRVDMLLKSVALLHADDFPVTCRIIGNGPERDALIALARDLSISDAVEFRHDVQDQAELYGLLKSSRVFVTPSEREGFGIAALEAIACGLPVVTTSAPDNLARHLVAKSARGVVCDSAARSIADAVKSILVESDPGAPGDSFGAESWLDDYSWAATAAEVSAALAL